MTDKELKELSEEIDNLIFKIDNEFCRITKKLDDLAYCSSKLRDECINRDLETLRK